MRFRQVSSLFLSMWMGIIILPYLILIFVNGPSSCLCVREPDVEDCLLWMVRLQAPEGFSLEEKKAEAVIARSNFYKDLEQGIDPTEKAKEIWEEVREKEIFRLGPEECELLCRVVDETRGEILTYEGELRNIPYHFCSGGKTRSGEEAFYDSSYSYLKAVDSNGDRQSPQYLTHIYLDKKQFPVDIEVTERDSCGYVMEMKLDGEIFSGEEFREEMGLPSGNFSIQELENCVRILCKGQGHGVGYSQYGGNLLASQGKDYLEILNVYFPAMSVENRRDFFEKM